MINIAVELMDVAVTFIGMEGATIKRRNMTLWNKILKSLITP